VEIVEKVSADPSTPWGDIQRAMKKGPSKRISGGLKGWTKIAEFLGQTVSVAQRWQKSGMPVTREGRSVYASPEGLTVWVGTERGQKDPIRIATEGEDLLGDLKQGLSYVRQQKKKRKPSFAAANQNNML
jgi:hypothetical protein